jgi:hypothetical protein
MAHPYVTRVKERWATKIHTQRQKSQLTPHRLYKVNCKWFIVLNVKCRTVETLLDCMGENPRDQNDTKYMILKAKIIDYFSSKLKFWLCKRPGLVQMSGTGP